MNPRHLGISLQKLVIPSRVSIQLYTFWSPTSCQARPQPLADTATTHQINKHSHPQEILQSETSPPLKSNAYPVPTSEHHGRSSGSGDPCSPKSRKATRLQPVALPRPYLKKATDTTPKLNHSEPFPTLSKYTAFIGKPWMR